MKSYTDIEQSRKLTEILPLESADMFYAPPLIKGHTIPHLKRKLPIDWDIEQKIPCWSLAALLDYLSANFHMDIKYLDNYWELNCRIQVTYNKELVDACYEMILKLNEQNII